MINVSTIMGNIKNRSIINYLNSEKYPVDLNFIADENVIRNRKLNLGTHPDMIELLWGIYSNNIPTSSRIILFGRPVLVNPNNGVLFGLVEGTTPPLLKLPEIDREILLTKGGKILLENLDGVYANAREVGDDWIYCFSFIEDLDKYFISAYNYSN